MRRHHMYNHGYQMFRKLLTENALIFPRNNAPPLSLSLSLSLSLTHPPPLALSFPVRLQLKKEEKTRPLNDLNVKILNKHVFTKVYSASVFVFYVTLLLVNFNVEVMKVSTCVRVSDKEPRSALETWVVLCGFD